MRTYGLIGKSLQHSFSPKYFLDKFVLEEIEDVQYLVFPLEKISMFKPLVNDYSLSGLNVTIPYKEKIIPYLDQLSPEADAIQAVNCIAFENGKLIGHNTDIIGFEMALKPFLKEQHKNALILGTGGASKAVAYVLENLNIEYQFVSTKKDQGFLSYDEIEKQLKAFPLIINTTPLGMFPDTDQTPIPNLVEIGKGHLVFDLIYNPSKTKFLLEAEAQGAQVVNGLHMLEIQAEESWKIWE